MLAGSCVKDLMMKTVAWNVIRLIRMPAVTHEFCSAHGTLITSKYDRHQSLIGSSLFYHVNRQLSFSSECNCTFCHAFHNKEPVLSDQMYMHNRLANVFSIFCAAVLLHIYPFSKRLVTLWLIGAIQITVSIYLSIYVDPVVTHLSCATLVLTTGINNVLIDKI